MTFELVSDGIISDPREASNKAVFYRRKVGSLKKRGRVAAPFSIGANDPTIGALRPPEEVLPVVFISSSRGPPSHRNSPGRESFAGAGLRG